jgi:hypothetical protein
MFVEYIHDMLFAITNDEPKFDFVDLVLLDEEGKQLKSIQLTANVSVIDTNKKGLISVGRGTPLTHGSNIFRRKTCRSI